MSSFVNMLAPLGKRTGRPELLAFRAFAPTLALHQHAVGELGRVLTPHAVGLVPVAGVGAIDQILRVVGVWRELEGHLTLERDEMLFAQEESRGGVQPKFL